MQISKCIYCTCTPVHTSVATCKKIPLTWARVLACAPRLYCLFMANAKVLNTQSRCKKPYVHPRKRPCSLVGRSDVPIQSSEVPSHTCIQNFNRSHKLTLGKLRKRVYKWPDPTRVTKKKTCFWKKLELVFREKTCWVTHPLKTLRFFLLGEHPYASLGLVTSGSLPWDQLFPGPQPERLQIRDRSQGVEGIGHVQNHAITQETITSSIQDEFSLNRWKKNTWNTEILKQKASSYALSVTAK